MHIAKFGAIKHIRRLTGRGLEALFENSLTIINVFLAEKYRRLRDYGQRHRRRTTHFARATAPGTYYMCRKNRERHGDYKHIFVGGRNFGFHERHGAHFAVDKWTRTKRRKKKVKTTADEEQKRCGAFKKAYTCSKNTMIFSEVNFREGKNC